MNFIEEFKKIISNRELRESFVSCSHLKQTRVFGFITTNIRNVSSFVVYIKELVPIYQSFENNNDLSGWKNYCKQHLGRDKQKYKRLEEAKIIFRNVENNSYLNNNAKIFYIDAFNLAQKFNLGNKINLIMLASLFNLYNTKDYFKLINSLKIESQSKYKIDCEYLSFSTLLVVLIFCY